MESLPYQCAVFVLPEIVFFPKTSLPLHVFEKHYIKMVEDSLVEKLPIALVSEKMAEDGRYDGLVCSIGHPIVLNENDDGSKLIVLQAERKVVLQGQIQKFPYLKYNYFALNETTSLLDENRFKLNRLRIELKNWIENSSTRDDSPDEFFTKMATAAQMINYGATFLLDSLIEKQTLIELNDVNKRLEQLLTYIELHHELDGEQPSL
jgi:Lon protease-like protein